VGIPTDALVVSAQVARAAACSDRPMAENLDKDHQRSSGWILGRISISISPVNADIVYALIEAKKTGLYRSGDKGLTWK